MGALYGLCLAVLTGIAFLARREPSPSRKAYYRSAAFLFRLTILRSLTGRQKPAIANGNVAKNLQTLNPGKNIDKSIRKYYVEKIRLALLLVFWGNLLSLSVLICQAHYTSVDITGLIRKNNWKQGSLTLDLQAESGNKEEIAVMIEPKSLTEKEAELLAKEAYRKLIPAILNENTGTDRISSNLNLISRLEDYPFHISWESSHPDIVKVTGEIVNKEIFDKELLSAEGTSVLLTAWLHYDDSYQQLRYKKIIEVKIYPQEKTVKEKWQDALYSAIESQKAKNAYDDTLQLPQTVQGRAVRWEEKSSTDSLYVWIIIITAAILLYAAKDSDLNKRVMKRNRQLEKDYPELVSKLALYLGAGMTVKNAWKKMVQDYVSNRTRYQSTAYQVLYEEMLISWHELENGVSEGEVYFQFGKRAGGDRYRKLSGLLYNHLQKGNNKLLHVLREEMEAAWEERKNKARISGEEMSTKLLFPMMIMLILVMVIIMVPAYLAF